MNDYDWYDYSGPGQIGSAHAVSSDEPDYDAVEELHRTVEEITRKPVDRPRFPFGFC